MSKGKLWGIILLILFVLGFGIWLYTSSDVKKDVDQEGIGVLDIFIISLLLVIIISLGTLAYQIQKAAYINPTQIMKTE